MKKVLIIGATSAIAEHCGRIWATRGDELYLVARNEVHLQTIAADYEVRGASSVAINCVNLNELDRHVDLLESAENAMNGVDVVLIAYGTLAEIQTNALSTISLLTLIANRFEAKKSGTICVISSVAGDRGRASNYVYGSAKAMVTAFTSGLRQRLHKSNVTVVTIKPGFVDTPMTSEFKKGFLWVKPYVVAASIVQAINKNRAEIYVPSFWWLIMLCVKLTPSIVFKKMKM
jgi:decaprenylphospho-beta-D-erythro-pentofuranosid-2-ulose 2-reductase